MHDDKRKRQDNRDLMGLILVVCCTTIVGFCAYQALTLATQGGAV